MNTHICPGCDHEIEQDAPQGLCPVCLVKGARVDSEGDSLRTALEAKLGAHYRIIRLLGRGGMGAVYLARDLSLDREVAIKVVRTSADQRTMHERFRREARTAARLSHPNIVPLYAFGEVEGMPYFVMGYVRGETLAERIRRDGKLPEDDARRILAEIADGLDHAHRQGIVHRDVKPDNVLLDDESGRALLTDFGVARGGGEGETLTEFGAVVGTPQYMSPEQASGRSGIDGRSDIYSLGVMAYAMIAGRLPFEGRSAADILTRQMTQDPPPLASTAPGVTDATAQAIRRCLAKDPAARWQDARSLKLALGVTEEASLPDALYGIESRAVLGLGATLGFMWIFLVLTSGEEEVFLVLELTLPILFLVAYAFVVMRVRREGFSLREIQRALWREPAWWLSWYPRSLRRAGNVWERMPSAVRGVRSSVFAFVLFMAAVYVDIAVSKALFGAEDMEPRFVVGARLDEAQTQFGLTLLGSIVGAWLVFTVRSRKMLAKAGLAPADANRIMLTVPPSRTSFWAKPHVAATLAPLTAAKASLASPHDYLQSIRRDADALSGPMRPLGGDAAVAARHLVDAVEDAERQIAGLARSLEPGEEERLSDRIEALGSAEEYAPMRTLLERQLQIVREMSARIEEAKERRNRRLEMLKTLALHMASLRERAAQASSEARILSDEVRGLCDEIGRQTQALSGTVPEGDFSTIGRAGEQ